MSGQGKKIDRRKFLRGAGAGVAAFSIVPRHVLGGPGQTPPSEKLNIACIGVGGRGRASLGGTKDENIVALCDVDPRRVGDAFEKFPQAKRYRDFRKMLDERLVWDGVRRRFTNHELANRYVNPPSREGWSLHA